MSAAGALTLGGATGYCTGKAVRIFGQGASVVLGITFIALQGAAYCGFVTVHWDKIQQAIVQVIAPLLGRCSVSQA